jgi:hypothetical protein
MGVPKSLLDRLRVVNASYFLTDKVKLYRIETFTDEFGGTYSDSVLIGEFPSRFVHEKYREVLIGGGIQARDEYEFVFNFNTPVEFQDKIRIVGDTHPNRYFLVTSVDDTTSEGIFNTAKCTESYN